MRGGKEGLTGLSDMLKNKKPPQPPKTAKQGYSANVSDSDDDKEDAPGNPSDDVSTSKTPVKSELKLLFQSDDAWMNKRDVQTPSQTQKKKEGAGSGSRKDRRFNRRTPSPEVIQSSSSQVQTDDPQESWTQKKSGSKKDKARTRADARLQIHNSERLEMFDQMCNN